MHSLAEGSPGSAASNELLLACDSGGMTAAAPGVPQEHADNQQPALTNTLSLADDDMKSRAESICVKVCSFPAIGQSQKRISRHVSLQGLSVIWTIRNHTVPVRAFGGTRLLSPQIYQLLSDVMEHRVLRSSRSSWMVRISNLPFRWLALHLVGTERLLCGGGVAFAALQSACGASTRSRRSTSTD